MAADQKEDSSIYTEIILDLYKNPVNYGEFDDPDLNLSGGNPSCGDEVVFHLRLEGDRVNDVRFHGHGCAISRASECILTEMVKGMRLEEVLEIKPDTLFDELGGVVQTRIKCGLLGLHVLKHGIRMYLKNPEKFTVIRGISI